jgi:hypothetical protein
MSRSLPYSAEHVQLPNQVLLCSPCASRHQVPWSASRVVPGAHRVVGPGTHRGSGPREVHTTPWQSSTAINRWPWCMLREASKNTMATLLDNFAMPWSCVHSPEHRARVSSPGGRRVLAKLGELHQSLYPRPARNPRCSMGQYMPLRTL